MMRRPSLLALALALVSILIPLLVAPSAASVKPSTLGAGLGLGLGLGPRDSGGFAGAIPMVNAGWRLGPWISVQSSVAYLREQSLGQSINYRALGSSSNPRDQYGESTPFAGGRTAHYAPVGVGLRLYLKQLPGQTGRGLFLEASPTVSVAWLPYPYPAGGHDTQLLRGVRGALGARFAALDGTRGEIGLTYYSMERATTTTPGPRTYPPIYGSTRSLDFDAFAVYVTFGFGD